MGAAEEYRLHARMVYRLCLRMLRNPAAAEDAAHDTFVKYLGGNFEGRSSVSTYLYAIATRVCLDRLRRVRRDRDFHARWRTLQEQAAIGGEDRAEGMVLVAELIDSTGLEDEDLYFAICYHVHGMTEQEIADMTGMKRRTVGYRLTRFRKQARGLAMGRDDGQDS